MKHKMAVLSLLFAGLSNASGITVPVDLGSPQIIEGGYTVYSNSLNGTAFNGQTVSIDYTFNHLIRLFPSTSRFIFTLHADTAVYSADYLIFYTSQAEGFTSSVALGRGAFVGFVLDYPGGGASVVNEARVPFGVAFPDDLAAERSGSTYLTGLHFDITLPNLNGLQIQNLEIGMGAGGNRPGQTRWAITDTVPEPGSSAAFLGLGLLALIGYRRGK